MSLVSNFKKFLNDRKIAKQRQHFEGYIRLSHVDNNGEVWNSKNNCGKPSTFGEYAIPLGMDYSQAFKVISFVIDKIQKDFRLDKKDYRTIQLANKALEKFHFERVEDSSSINPLDITDVLIDESSQSYIGLDGMCLEGYHWYTKGVSDMLVKTMYDKIGLEVSFDDFKPEDVKGAPEHKYNVDITDTLKYWAM